MPFKLCKIVAKTGKFHLSGKRSYVLDKNALIVNIFEHNMSNLFLNKFYFKTFFKILSFQGKKNDYFWNHFFFANKAFDHSLAGARRANNLAWELLPEKRKLSWTERKRRRRKEKLRRKSKESTSTSAIFENSESENP